MSVAINPTTGMPEVPDGYFWRVFARRETDFDDWPTLTVQLRRHAPRFYNSNRTVEVCSKSYFLRTKEELNIGRYGAYNGTDPAVLPDGILNAAEEVLASQADYLKYLTRQKELEVALKALTGDYPPKALQ